MNQPDSLCRGAGGNHHAEDVRSAWWTVWDGDSFWTETGEEHGGSHPKIPSDLKWELFSASDVFGPYFYSGYNEIDDGLELVPTKKRGTQILDKAACHPQQKPLNPTIDFVFPYFTLW